MTSLAACITCYVTEVVLVAILLGAGIWLYSTDHTTPGNWCVGFALLVVFLWSCRYTLGVHE